MLVVREGLSLEGALEQRPECYLKVWSWLAYDQNLGLEEWEGFGWEESVSEDGERSKLGTAGMRGRDNGYGCENAFIPWGFGLQAHPEEPGPVTWSAGWLGSVEFTQCVCELRVLCELSWRRSQCGDSLRPCNSRGSQKPSLSRMKSLPTGHCLKFHHPSFIFSTW